MLGFDPSFEISIMVSLLVSWVEERNPTAASRLSIYWEIGRRIVENEPKGRKWAEYGSALLRRLSNDLTARFGRGFG